MAKSIQDKLFWLNIIKDFDSVVDYGCADGSLLKMLHNSIPDVLKIGYDIDSNMIDAAQKNFPEAIFTTRMLKIAPTDHTVLNCSSVIHEVYSYAKSSDCIEDFWSIVFCSNYKYISIRDLCISKEIPYWTNRENLLKVMQKSDRTQIEDFVKFHGSLNLTKNYIHYLLKYRYKNNWQREVRENYLPITLEELLEKIPNTYKIKYLNHYTLPFTQEQIYKDFGVSLGHNTHVKLLLEHV